MYQALYRKYRSKTFEELVGQRHVTEALKNQIINNEFSHAYLFSGTRGTGKTSAAKILSRAVNCEHTVDGNPCNECESCKSILEDKVMDVVEMDAASNNGVDDIRELKDKVIYPPQNLKYKIYIIDEVHMLSKGAFNALLKILEEPPAHLIFILATTEPEKIPATILSRLQRYNFKRISNDEIIANLQRISEKENRQVEEEVFRLIANNSDGAMRDSLSLLDQLFSFSDEVLTYDRAIEILGIASSDFLFNLADAIINRDLESALKEMDVLYKGGKDISILISDLITHFRNILVIGSTNSKDLVYTDKFNEYMNQVKTVSLDRLINIIKILNNALSTIKYSSDKRVMFEMCLVELCIEQADLEKRIEELEQKLMNGYEVSPSISKTQLEVKKTNTEIKLTKKDPIESVSATVENDNEQVRDTAEPIDIKPNKDIKLDNTVVITKEKFQKEWNIVISNLKNRNKMSTAVLLEKVREFDVVNNTIVLYFDVVDEVYYKMSSRQDNRDALISILKEMYSDEIELKIVMKDLKNREQSLQKLKELVGEENIDII